MALLVSVLFLTLVLFMVLYFLSFTAVEKKISSSQLKSSASYYLAESAVNDLIYQLNNDILSHTNFNSSTTWQKTISRTNFLGQTGANYVATIANVSKAHGVIIATSSLLNPDGKISQRVLKINVFRAVGTSTFGNYSMMTDGPITISGSEITYNGSIHSNSSIAINNGSDIAITGELEAVGALSSSGTASTITVSSSTYASNKPLGPAATSTIPAVDFNTSTTTSLKAMADYIYTAAAFDETKLANDGTIYVIGSVTIDNKTGTYNHKGALVVEGNLSLTYKRWDMQPVSSTSTKPVGLFASGNLTLASPNGGQEGTLNGVLYAGNKIILQLKPMGSTHTLVINGAIIAKTIDLVNIGTGNGGVIISTNSTYINQSLPSSNWSPIISTDHWEEQY